MEVTPPPPPPFFFYLEEKNHFLDLPGPCGMTVKLINFVGGTITLCNITITPNFGLCISHWLHLEEWLGTRSCACYIFSMGLC